MNEENLNKKLQPLKERNGTKSFHGQRYKYIFAAAIFFCATFIVISLNNCPRTIYHNKEYYEVMEKLKTELHEDKYLVKTEGCTIPSMNPWDPSIKEYVKHPKIKPCTNVTKPLIERNTTHIWVTRNATILSLYDVKKKKRLICCYRGFYRPNYVEDIYSNYIDDRTTFKDCVPFHKSKKVDDEFIYIQCFYDTNVIYHQFYVFPRKILSSTKYNIMKSTYNVVILGIDGVSRLNFHRTMPKTAAFMKKRNGIELLGYNKVGDNSYPNLVPLLLGYDQYELKYICHPTKHSNYDDCPFIWHWFKEAGFNTAFAEDSAYLATFNYFLDGFRRNPTDYYIRPFMLKAEYVGKNKVANVYLCMNDVYFYEVLLKYIEDVINAQREARLFGFFWETSISHDYLNFPMIMDDNYVQFLQRLEDSKYLDDTIIFLLSDHGLRWGGIRSTKQGRLEERLPLLYMLTPKSFRENYSLAYQNFQQNSKKLTTPFDLHETLLDLINLENITNAKITERSVTNYSSKRGISLFLPISGNRTCETAAISDHWCTCHTGKKISIWSPEARDGSAFLITYLNSLVADYKLCIPLELEEIFDATEMVAQKNQAMDSKEFLIVIKAKPSGGIFEATLRSQGSNWTVSGTVSRLNMYGEQSSCIDDALLKLYCFCE